MLESSTERISRREKLAALADVATYKPRVSFAIIGLGIVTAVLEGIGLSFVLPMVELVQYDNPIAQAEGITALFVFVYRTAGMPFTLGYVVLGVSFVMLARYTTSFVVAWFREALRTYYIRDLQDRALKNSLNAKVEYFDKEGSDDILNAIVTQTYYAGRVIKRGIRLLVDIFLAGVYLLIALFISPMLTLLTVMVLGSLTLFIRWGLESGYDVGDKVADANEKRQASAQAATQGIRDVRIFGLTEQIYQQFQSAIQQYTQAQITLRRNEAAINSFYNLGVAVTVFILIYLALSFANLSLGSLGVFLLAMFRLGPRVSNVNKSFYQVENDLPHLVRTLAFIEELENYAEQKEASRDIPEEIEVIEFDDVWFSYNDDEQVLRGINFEIKKGQFVGFVGQSGSGKSTITSLLARMYERDSGEIKANGISIEEFDVREWRGRLSMVRQNPYVFNDTLRYNLTFGNQDISNEELNRVCEIAQVNEFLTGLPEGYDTALGDDGVRLSGGQKQRVAIARALLVDADLLILDEATSDLDSNLEQQVHEAIEDMNRDYAILTVAHQLSTVQNADQIYTIENGRITESGKHGELLDNGGKYAELYQIQSSG